MPSPVLLIHGTGLANTTFTGVPVTRTINSPNGHWAIVWLDAHGRPASTLHLIAHDADGTTSFNYTLAARCKNIDGMAGFSPADVMMCIMPDRFADGDLSNDHLPGFAATDRHQPRAYRDGDLKGVIDHLDYLQELSVTAVWLTPILSNNPASHDYHGYGTTDLYSVDPRLGTLADY